MQEFDNYIEIAKHFNVKEYEVEKACAEQGWRGKFFINNSEIKIESYDNKPKYVIVDENNDKSCKEYLLKYEIPEYNWKVYVDDIEGWQNCKVLDIQNNGLDISRAKIETDSCTILNRIVEYSLDEESIVKNRNIFMIEKYEENEFYSTKDKILLATSIRGGYFLNLETNKVENIVNKDSGYANCIYGSIDYMRKNIKLAKDKGVNLGFKYTDKGKELLGIKEEKIKSLSERLNGIKEIESANKRKRKSIDMER